MMYIVNLRFDIFKFHLTVIKKTCDQKRCSDTLKLV